MTSDSGTPDSVSTFSPTNARRRASPGFSLSKIRRREADDAPRTPSPQLKKRRVSRPARSAIMAAAAASSTAKFVEGFESTGRTRSGCRHSFQWLAPPFFPPIGAKSRTRRCAPWWSAGRGRLADGCRDSSPNAGTIPWARIRARRSRTWSRSTRRTLKPSRRCCAPSAPTWCFIPPGSPGSTAASATRRGPTRRTSNNRFTSPVPRPTSARGSSTSRPTTSSTASKVDTPRTRRRIRFPFMVRPSTTPRSRSRRPWATGCSRSGPAGFTAPNARGRTSRTNSSARSIRANR